MPKDFFTCESCLQAEYHWRPSSNECVERCDQITGIGLLDSFWTFVFPSLGPGNCIIDESECDASVLSETCKIKTHEWSKSIVFAGEDVELIVNGEGNCDGKNIELKYFEKSGEDGLIELPSDYTSNLPKEIAFAGNTASKTWEDVVWFEDRDASDNDTDPEIVFETKMHSSTLRMRPLH